MNALKGATHEAHQYLHRVVDLHQMISSPECYLKALRQYLRVIDPLECGLAVYHRQNEHLVPDVPGMNWSERLCKARWLREDLNDIAPATVSVKQTLNVVARPVQTQEGFVGRTYVLEGLTLGAVPILKMINGAPALSNLVGTRFFAGYHSRTSERWLAYSRWACQQSIDRQAAVEEALITFNLFSEALQQK